MPLCVGTHGSGIKIGNLATFVVRLELVTGQGQVLTVSATDNTDIFRAAQVRISLGQLQVAILIASGQHR